MRVSEVFSGGYFKASDVTEKGMLVTIQTIEVEEFQQDNRVRQQPVLYFKEDDKGLVLNRTNADTIAAYLGDEMGTWTNKPVVLFLDPTVRNPSGIQTGGVRVRRPKTYVPEEVVEESLLEDESPF